MEFPARRVPYFVVGVLLASMLAASLLFFAISGAVGGLIAAVIFALALVPTARRGFDKGPALTAGPTGLDARAAGVRLSWDDVSGVRHHTMPTPGTGGRGFLVVGLSPDAQPERTSVLAPRPKDADGGRELWIPMTGIEAAPEEVLAGVQQARSEARSR
jgi:hypothetical protein